MRVNFNFAVHFCKQKIFILFILISIISCKSSFDKAKEFFDVGNLIEARKFAKRISNESKMFDSAKILIQNIDMIEDSIVNYNDSISFQAAKQAFLKNSFEQSVLLSNEVNCKYIRPSSFCDSATNLRNLANHEILKLKEENRIQEIIGQLDREISSLKKSSYKEKSEPTDIQIAIVLLGAYQKIIDDNKKESDKRVKNRLAILEALVKQNRINTLPKLRRDYANIMRKLMWQHDMDISSFGTGNKILELTSVIFASNKGIQSIQEALKDTPRLLRYSQVRYKWYEGSDRYTYYDLKTPKDSDPFLIQ